ncbi:MAG: hypothetical protein ACR2O6_08160, partial [Ilumatobacteraceae bacterium]
MTVEHAAVVLATRDLDAEVQFLTEEAGFRLDAVFPADDPAIAILSGGGLRVRITRADAEAPVTLRSVGDEERRLRSPGGSTIEIAPREETLWVPPPRPVFHISRSDSDDAWVTGRAGMRYRDLLPDRWGGRYIASHIHIPEGGPVPDYVHYHRIRFQVIVVKAGWVEVVYEDQGPPFRMHAGDAVLQPPEIRHRVLHSSADLEVIEIGCPAEHMTLVDHELDLPTTELRPDRNFGGQRFARSVLADRPVVPWAVAGFVARDTGFGDATGGLVEVRIVEPGESTGDPEWPGGDTELAMLVVLDGSLDVLHDGAIPGTLGVGDAVAVPA